MSFPVQFAIEGGKACWYCIYSFFFSKDPLKVIVGGIMNTICLFYWHKLSTSVNVYFSIIQHKY